MLLNLKRLLTPYPHRPWRMPRRLLLLSVLLATGFVAGRIAWERHDPYRDAFAASILADADTWWDWLFPKWPRQKSKWIEAGTNG